MAAASGAVEASEEEAGPLKTPLDAQFAAQMLIDHHDEPTSLPLPLMQLLDLLVDSLAPPTPNETRELVVRSLRSCSSRVVEGHDRILQSVTPLLLDHFFPLRLQAAGCLLQYSSTATTSTLRKHVISISNTISRALVPLQYSSQHSALRLVSTCLRILHVLCGKLSPLPPEAITTITPLLGIWVYYKPGLAGGASPTPNRGRLAPSSSALAFGVMGAFAPPSPTKKKSVRSHSRSSSRSSLGGWGSDSEEEEAQVEQRKDAVQVRLDALACLKTLASNDGRSLYTQWNLFFADSPYLRHRPSLINLVESDPSSTVRLRACSALTALLEESSSYLAIAEDRPTKASFTSLSSRLGEIVGELHLKLASLISNPTMIRHPELLLALLKLAETLGANSPYSRMSRPLAQPLAGAVSPLLQSEDPARAIAAAAALTSIARNALSSSSTSVFNAQDLAQRSIGLLQSSVESDLQAAAWSLLGATSSRAEGLILSPALVMLQEGFETAPVAVQEAQMEWIASLFKPVAPSPNSPTPTSSLRPYLISLLRVVRVATTSERSQLRVMACGVLASPMLPELDDQLPPFNPVMEGVRMTSDEEPAVRSAASRALGVLVKAPSLSSSLNSLKTVLDALIPRCKDDDLVRASASWSVANCCDLFTLDESMSLDFPLLLDTILPLAAVSSGDKIQANGLRALGSLLKVLQNDSSISADEITGAVETLCNGLRTGPAKVRWNAASAIASALTSPLLASGSSHVHLPPRLLDALSSTLSSSVCTNYKVRIQAATGLALPRDSSVFGGADKFELVRRRVMSARAELKEEEQHVPGKERVHLSQLMLKLDRCSAQLDSLAIDVQ